MKVFIANHGGVILGGISIIVAQDEIAARYKLIEVLLESKLPVEIYDIQEYDLSEPGVRIIWNGDY